MRLPGFEHVFEFPTFCYEPGRLSITIRKALGGVFMAERVAERVRRLLREQPGLEIRFTEAIRPDSYYQGPVVLFLHPTHQALVDELRAERRRGE
jgi:hypothetical protein